ncbi:MAG: hypothetical protein E6J90_05590 [Deltaproteobacteria bacterium]|nr:MAG: hypothetical protein E6J91_22670 [Deltaproteobacteria bacterium]TMQ25652.1 MAG: hypothetical protein E6J90_05590 [Deltaproteobacteria bacterium]
MRQELFLRNGEGDKLFGLSITDPKEGNITVAKGLFPQLGSYSLEHQGDGDPRIRLARLSEALVRDCLDGEEVPDRLPRNDAVSAKIAVCESTTWSFCFHRWACSHGDHHTR